MTGLNSRQAVSRVSSRVSVETPEQIDFTFETAGLAPRLAAYLIDLCIRAFGISIVSLVVVLLTGGAPFGIGIISVLLFLVEWGYFTLIEWLTGGVTPGKKALHLRVVRTNGVRLDLYRSALRNLLRAADGFPPMVAMFSLFPVPSYALGILSMFVLNGRRIGDFVADTMVVVDERPRIDRLPDMPAPLPLSPAQLALLKLSARELAAVDAFFRRRHHFSADRVEELAKILAEPLAARLGMATCDSLSLLAGVLQAGMEQRSSVIPSLRGKGKGAPP